MEETILSGVWIAKEQKKWLEGKHINFSRLVRVLLKKIMEGDIDITIKEVLKEAWQIKERE